MEPIRFLSASDLKAVSHPLRQRILALMVRRGELSGREVVELLPGAPANPYYHLGVLHEAGLIRVARREKRRGSEEKYYAPVARTFSMDPGELVGGEGSRAAELRRGILSVARNGAEEALGGLARALERNLADPERDPPFVNLCTLRIRAERAQELRLRLKAWVEDAVEAGRECALTEEEETCVEYTFYQLFFRAGRA